MAHTWQRVPIALRARTFWASLVALLALAVLVPASAGAAVSCPNSNPVVNENNCMGAGTGAWQVQNYSENLGGFTPQTSYNLGQDVPLKIGTGLGAGRHVNIAVFRIGDYGGTGGRLVNSQSNVAVNNSFTCNPMDPNTGELSCANWAVTATIPASSMPVSGIYEALFTDPGDANIQNYVVFAVRDDGRHSQALFVLPTASYQAYNNWGGKSLYFDKNGGASTVSGTDRAVAVSFDRPLDAGMVQVNRFFGPDIGMVQWLEQQGYDVSYTDDIQTDVNGASLKQHNVDIISGHSEYWSAATFNNFRAARDAGVNIASFSGNTAYWQTRYANNNRTLICYKTIQGPNTPNDPASLGPDGIAGTADDQPQFATTTRRDPGAPASTPGTPPGGRIGPNQPENSLLGNMYVGDNDSVYYGLTIPAADNGGDFSGSRLWRNTGLSTTSATTIGTGIVGWEWDQIPNPASPVYAAAALQEPAGVKQLTLTDVTNAGDSFLQDAGNLRANTPPAGQPSNVSAVEYRAASGAYVFAAGTNLWANGLGDSRISQATYNIFSDMGVQPATPVGLTLDQGGQPAAPWASFTATPNPVRFGSPVSFDASGTFVGSGASIVDYQWDWNGDGHFSDAGATATATHTFTTQGTYNVHLKVTDSLGRSDSTTRTLTVTGDPPPTASFTVTPAKPVVGQTATLDGSGSKGPVNPITDYKWDLDGSGNYATDTGATKTTTTSFATAGSHTVGLRVTDSTGKTGTTTVSVTVLATGASSYPDAVHATPGLLHYYRLGESAGPTVADSAGSATGTISGGTFGAPGAIQGDPNTALSFNGTSDFGQIPMDLSGSSKVTVEFWLKWNAYANDDRLAMEFTPNFTSGPGGFLVDPNSTDGTFSVATGFGGSRNIAAFTRPTAGAWHYYAFVLDTTAPGATAITPYVDGQPVSYTKQGASGTGAGNFANSSLYLFSRGGTSLFGSGSLDELALYNGALDPTRVQDHYNSFGTNSRPVASLSITPTVVKPGQTVTLDASGSHYANGTITQYEWDLNGDGVYDRTTTTPTITTSYSTAQTVNIGLRVTSSDFGTDYTTKSLLVGNATPVPSLTAAPNPAIVNQTVKFDGSGSTVPNGTVTGYKWDLDGSGNYATDTGTNPTVSHAFASTGTYTIGLQVTSDAGLTARKTISLQVLDQGVGSYHDAVVNTPGVQHYYRLDETAGPTVRDSVGSANGTITGGTFGAPGAVQGDPNTALSFNGTGDSGAIPMDLSGSPVVTVEFWLKWNAYANDDSLAMEFTNNFNNNLGGFLIDPNSSLGQFAVSIGNGGSRNLATFARPSVGVWHHYALVLDTTAPGATAITPYVDGQAVSYTKQGYTGTGAGKFANSTLYLMSRGGSSLFGAGTLDELAVYTGALSANTVADHYAAHGTNQAPTAAFTVTPQSVAVNGNVALDASGSTAPSGQIVDYQWDLDGSGRYATDTGTNPRLTTSFSSPGTKTIGLRVIDSANASATASHTVLVGDAPPSAAFTITPSPLAYVGQTVNFDGSSSTDAVGTITDYKWDLDGSGNYATDTGATPKTSRVFNTPGLYSIGLRVTNDQGQTSTVTQTVNVHAASYQNTVLGTAGLLSYWRLNEAAGATTLADSKGTSNSTNFRATLGTGGPLFGNPDTAAGFDGATNYVAAPLDLSSTSQVTVEFWLNWSAYSNNDALAMEFTNNFNNNTGGFLVDPNASEGNFGVAVGTGASRNTAYFTRPSAGQWHYYAFVLDTNAAAASQITPYVDGQPVSYTKSASGTGAGPFANSNLYLMSRAGTSLFGPGTLGQVAVYNQALGASVLAGHYAAGTASTAPSNPSGPSDALSLAPGASGASLNSSGTTLYYNGSAAGSFKLVDAVTDSGSAPASATFPAISTTGWTHGAETVSTGSGSAPTISYTSSGFSWTAAPSNPSGYSVSSKDAAGNTSAGASPAFVNDTSAPGGGALAVNGTAATAAGSSSSSTSASFAIGTRTDYAEAQSSTQSGLASSTLTVQSETLTGATCGTPGSGGPFTSPTTITATTQPSGIVGGFCYRYTLTGTDNVANSASVATTVAVTSVTNPTVSSISPTSLGQGATAQNVVVNGSGFASGATVSFSGTGITVTSTTFVSSSQVKATVSVAPGASTGAAAVTVTNPGGGSGSLSGALTVDAGPTLTSLSPGGLGQGARNQTVTVTGSGFISGAPLAATITGHSGVSVSSTTFVSATQLTLNISVSPTAAAASDYTVTVTNGDNGTTSTANGFTVSAAPTVTSLSPGALVQGTNGRSVTINGSGFVSGSGLAASFSGTGITVNSTSFVSSTQLTANVTVSANAAVGHRDVTVTNPDHGSFTCAGCLNVFSITRAAHGGASGVLSVTSTSFRVNANTTYLVFASSHSNVGDVATPSASGFSSTPAFTAIAPRQDYNGSADHNWAWSITGAPAGNGTGTITISFAIPTMQANVEVIALGGNNAAAPIVTSSEGFAVSGGSALSTARTNPATAALTTPGIGDAEVIFWSSGEDASSTAPRPSSPLTALSASYNHAGFGSSEIFAGAPAQASVNLTMSAAHSWGTIALEINQR